MQGARDALERYGTGLTGSRLLNGTIPLHLELEREIAEWMGTEDAIVFTTGHQANVGTLGTLLGPGDTVVADSGDHASILDGCLLSRAKLRPFRHNRLDKLERTLERAARRRRRRPRRRRRRLLHGGRHRAAAARSATCASATARGSWSTRPTAPACWARAARAPPSCSASRTASTCAWARSPSRWPRCGGFVAGPAEVIEFLRDPVARLPLHRRRGAGGGRRGAGRAADRALATRAASSWRACWPTRGYLQRRAARARLPGRERQPPGGTLVTPIVPVLVGDDWKAVAAVARALRRRRLRQHRAAPGGPAGRRAAAHERHGDPRQATLDRALDAFAGSRRPSRPSTGRCPALH